MVEDHLLKILIVGAGAVGQVYARHLHASGAAITFLVKEKHRAEAQRGFNLYWLNQHHGGQPFRFNTFAVVTSAAEVAAQKFDQVWLCIAGPALQGPWLPELVSAMGDATLVVFSVGPEDRAIVTAAGAPATQIVNGLITMASYAAPLEGETGFGEPGTAYYQPPFLSHPFSGPAARVTAVASALKRGGLPTSVKADVPKQSAFASSVLMVLLGALEKAHWSLQELRSTGLPEALAAVREALAIVSVDAGPVPLPMRLLFIEPLTRFAIWLFPLVAPLPLEPYLKKHFTKVLSQTRQALARLKARRAAAGLPSPALDSLPAHH